MRFLRTLFATALLAGLAGPVRAQEPATPTLTLEPTSATRLVAKHNRHQAVATVRDANGDPVVGVTVAFHVVFDNVFDNPEFGAPESTTLRQTGADGRARHVTEADRPHVQRIHAWADGDDDRREDPDEPSDDATVRWRPPAGPAKPALVRGTTWYLRGSLTAGLADRSFTFGPGGVPLFGDWDGDGTDTPGWYRDGVFHLRNANSAGPADIVFSYGRPGEVPVVGDWDGDGTDTIGVVRDTTWHLRNSTDYRKRRGVGDLPPFRYGLVGDRLVAGDWDGDGADSPGVFRTPAGAQAARWYLRNRLSTGTNDVPTIVFGVVSATPLVGDWDRFGADRLGVAAPGNVYLRYRLTAGDPHYGFRYGNYREGGSYLTW